MIGQATGHGRSQQHLSPFALSRGFAPTQLMMRPTQVIGAAKQPHAAFQSRQASSRMPTLARQTGESLAHRAVQAFDESGIEHRSSVRSLKQPLRLLQRSLNHLARDVYHAFLFRPFDHDGDTQLRPYP